jgi:lipopolysaccharide/colanic/teichoic acid biosynthesis glycosyltransferase
MDTVPWKELEPRGLYPSWGRPALNFSFAVLITPAACLIGLLVGCVNLVLFRDPRKILFIQTRFGHRGRAFRMYKFRTMRDASIGAHDSWRRGEDRARVTRFGRLLRNSHLDELPQLINVLRGEMNVIGPRPEMIEIEVWASEHVPGFSRRLALKPGITGPAQITQGYTGCDVAGYSLKAAINESYRRELSLRTDLLIAVRTAIWMVRGRGWKWNVPAPTAPASVVPAEKSAGPGHGSRRDAS